MAVIASYQTGQDGDNGVGDAAGVEYRRAQGFQVTQAAIPSSVELYLKNGGTPPTDSITIRIETDNAGIPSGTLVHANATATITAASIGAAYAFVASGAFAGAFTLAANTPYHIVTSIPNQADNVFFLWGSDDSSPTYTLGTYSSSSDGGSTWSASAGSDLLFIVNGIIIGGNAIAFEI